MSALRKVALVNGLLQITTSLRIEDARQLVADLERVIQAAEGEAKRANPNAKAKAVPLTYGEEEWQA